MLAGTLFQVPHSHVLPQRYVYFSSTWSLLLVHGQRHLSPAELSEPHSTSMGAQSCFQPTHTQQGSSPRQGGMESLYNTHICTSVCYRERVPAALNCAESGWEVFTFCQVHPFIATTQNLVAIQCPGGVSSAPTGRPG